MFFFFFSLSLSLSLFLSAAKMTEKIAAALEAQKSAGGTSIPSAADAVVTDMTACVGGNVISFARRFRAVNAIEIDATRHAMLKHNVAVVAEHANVTFVQGDAVSLLLNPTASPLVQDVLFMDPPWGGPDYM
jgi:16S rRNA G966 N2-methylase RsmD